MTFLARGANQRREVFKLFGVVELCLTVYLVMNFCYSWQHQLTLTEP